MPKYYFYLIILINAFLNVSDSLAMNRKIDEVEGIKSSRTLTQSNDLTQSMGPLVSLHSELKSYIATFLDPLSLCRLLLTNKALGNAIRMDTSAFPIKPIPFGEGLLQEEIAVRLNLEDYPMDDESYMRELCHRLTFSFKPIFGTNMTWDCILPLSVPGVGNFLGDPGLPEIRVAIDLMELYRKLTKPQNEENPDVSEDVSEDRERFGEDTQDRRDAIKYIRPILLVGYLRKELFNIRSAQDIDDDVMRNIKDMLQAFRYYEAVVAEEDFFPIDFGMWALNLVNASWRAEAYHESIGLDISGNKEVPEKFRSRLNSSLAVLNTRWQRKLINLPYESLTKLSFQDISNRINGGLAEMVEMMGPEHFSLLQTKDTFIATIKRQLNIYLHSHVFNKASRPVNMQELLDASLLYRQAFYWIEVAALTEDLTRKRDAYNIAAQLKWSEAQAWQNKEYDEEQEEGYNLEAIEAYSQCASYHAQVASLYSDPTQKIIAYRNAAQAKEHEAKLWDEEQDNDWTPSSFEREVSAWALVSLYHKETASLYTDPVQRADAYCKAGEAKRKEADILDGVTLDGVTEVDGRRRAGALALSSDYYYKAASLYRDTAQKIEAYRMAAQAKSSEADAWGKNSDTRLEKKTEALALSALYYQKEISLCIEEASLNNDPDQKANSYQKAGEAKSSEVGLATTDEERADAWGAASGYYLEAASLYTDLDQKAEAYTTAGKAKVEEANLLKEETNTELKKKADAWETASWYLQKAASFYTDAARKANAYRDAGEAKWSQANLLREKEEKSEAFAQCASYYAMNASFKGCVGYFAPHRQPLMYGKAREAKWREADLLEGTERVNAAKEAQKFHERGIDSLKEINWWYDGLKKYRALLWSSLISFKLNQWDKENMDEQENTFISNLDEAHRTGEKNFYQCPDFMHNIFTNTLGNHKVSVAEKYPVLWLTQGILDSLAPERKDRGRKNLQAIGEWAKNQITPDMKGFNNLFFEHSSGKELNHEQPPLETVWGELSLEDLKKGEAIMEDQRIVDFIKKGAGPH